MSHLTCFQVPPDGYGGCNGLINGEVLVQMRVRVVVFVTQYDHFSRNDQRNNKQVKNNTESKLVS